MKESFIATVFAFIAIASNGQDTDSLFNRLQGLKNNGQHFFNIDGIQIDCIRENAVFTPASIASVYRKLRVKAKELTTSDSLLSRRNYYKPGQYEWQLETFGFLDCYFVEDRNDKGRAVAFAFTSTYKVDQEFQRTFITLFLDGKIPDVVYQPETTSRVDFAGRELTLWGGCRWMSQNNLQCPYNGQMNWSSFKRKELAQKNLDDHFKLIEIGGHGDVLSKEQVDVIFEGVETTARKIIVRPDHARTPIAGWALAGGQTLTAYFVLVPVRGKFVTCVISHWDNDYLNENGLPSLAAQVMTLK